MVRPELAAPAGVYVCSRRVLDHVEQTGYQDIKEGLLSVLHQRGEPVDASVRVPLTERRDPQGLAIEQRSSGSSPRSIIATTTEIYDYLRLLYAHVGQPYCPETGVPVVRETTSDIVDKILALPPRVLTAPTIPTGGAGPDFEALRWFLLPEDVAVEATLADQHAVIAHRFDDIECFRVRDETRGH